MKTLLKTAIITALAATSLSTSVSAQDQISKRERIFQVVDQSRPNQYVPAAFFLHFKDKLGRKAVDAHREFYKATNMDIVKVFYEIVVPHVEVKKGSDWKKVPVYDESFFEPQLELIEDLAKEFKGEALIMPTVYAPVRLAGQGLGKDDAELRRLAEEDPDAFAQAIKNYSLTIENYLRAARRRGADGFYVSSRGGDGNSLPDYIWKKIRPYDKYVSEVADEIGEINILHICDFGSPFKNAEALYAFTDYPGSIVNVPQYFTDGSTLDLKEAAKRFNRPIFGGLNRKGVIGTGSIEEIKKEVDEIMENAPDNFILGSDCTIPGDTDYDKLRAVIEYAHTWRQTHNNKKK